MSSQTPSADDYDIHYLGWKEWGCGRPFGHLEKHEKVRFDAEIRKTGLKTISNVLEIGFGNGGFLSYAKNRGWNIKGSEMSQELLAIAKKHGFDAIDAKTTPALANDSFDLILAFDVLEHIPQEEILPFLAMLKSKLRKQGAVIARFPNGDSPLGLPYQNGDPTHTNAIGSNKIRYWAHITGFEIVALGAESVPLFSTCLPLFFYALVSKPIKWVLEIFAHAVFFPKRRFCFTSPNLVVVLKKNQ